MNKRLASIVLNPFTNDNRVHKEAVTLTKNGFKVTVFALHESGLDENEITDYGYSVNRVFLKSRKLSKNKLVQLFKYLEFLFRTVARTKKFQYHHCHDLNALPVSWVVKVLFNRNLFIVYDAHEYETETNGTSKAGRVFKKILERHLIKRVDSVITVSDTIADEYVRLYNIRKPYVVLNTPYFSQEKKTKKIHNFLGLPESSKIILYQGAFSSGRGIEILIEAFKKLNLKNTHLVFMGYGTLLENILAETKISSEIHYIPARKQEELQSFTSSADFGVCVIQDTCLSYRYCLPNKLFEYVMSNVMVIASDLPEISKIIKLHGLGFLTENNNLESLMKAIQLIEYKSNEEISDEVKKKYSWESQEGILIDAYERR